MSEFKGTKGEWKIQHSESKTASNIVGTIPGGKYKIARIPYFNIGSDEYNKREKYEAEANAKLIAAAPELLDALKGLIEWSAHFPKAMNKELEFAIKTIKKATE